MIKVVIDTNIWIRALLGGAITLPVLEAWMEHRFEVLISQPLLDELDEVWRRPRLCQRIDPRHAQELLEQLRWRATQVDVITPPPACRDPKDHPVLATAIDGKACAIVSGDGDLRADNDLREAMADLGIEIWGINTLLSKV